METDAIENRKESNNESRTKRVHKLQKTPRSEMLPFLCLFKTFLHCHPIDVFTKSCKKSHPCKGRLQHIQRMSNNNCMHNRSVQLEVKVDDIPLSKADGSGISFFIDLTTEREVKSRGMCKE